MYEPSEPQSDKRTLRMDPNANHCEEAQISVTLLNEQNGNESTIPQSVPKSEDLNKNVAILELSTDFEKSNRVNSPITPQQMTSGSNSILQPVDPKTVHTNVGTNNTLNPNGPSVECRQQIVTNQSLGFKIPIVGYEIMEERARFTIYKLRIDDPRTGLSWMVFRRYTDFVRLYSKLKMAHTTINLPLPGKRWFKDNFDPRFLDERIRGLQLFINAVIKNLSSDIMVRDFFCLDEPPPVCDSEPESLALFTALEDTVKSLKNQLRLKEEALTYLQKKVMYFEEKMKSCKYCNPSGHCQHEDKADLPSSSNSR